MPVKINGSSSGSVTLAAPASGSDVTLTLPGSTGTVPLLAGSNTWTGTQSFAGATLTGAGLDLITTQSFSAASSVSVNGCFTATYENYLLAAWYTTSGGVDVRLRMRSSSTDNSTSNYFFAGTRTTTAASVSGFGGASATYFQVCSATGSSPIATSFAIHLMSPQAANRTQYSGTGAGYAGGTSTYTAETMGGQFVDTTAFDGLTLYPSSGTITGTIRVYGYRN